MLRTENTFLDLKEAAQLLGVSEATVLQLAVEGTLPISMGRPRSGLQILFHRRDLLQFEAQHTDR